MRHLFTSEGGVTLSGCQDQCSRRSFSYFGLALERIAEASTSGPGCPVLDPFRENGDLIGGEMLFRRHLQIFIRLENRLNQ